MATDTYIKSFTHLKDRKHAERALPMLQRVASLVKPIMRKHGWVLPMLSEFFPAENNLVGLNVNGGEKILLRLRPAWAPDTFYDIEQVVAVMLHELTHNVHGPHDDTFYKYLAGLEDEYDALKRSGYAGEGFFSPGHRLGANVSHDVSPHLARLKALQAAEKRRQTSGVLGSGGRLGGRGVPTRGMSPRELAAQAAERRAQDEKACGSGAVAQREAEKAAKESIEDRVIDLTLDDDAVVRNPGPSKSSTARNPQDRSRGNVNLSKPLNNTSSRAPPAPPTHTRPPPIPNYQTRPKLPTEDWSCPTCTLLNGPFALQCDVCLTSRPPDLITGWMCMTCGETGMPHEFWTCRFCGTLKAQS